MEYDFTSIIDRRGKDALAVDRIPIPQATVREGFTAIPMWVADMNFATVPTVTQAIIARAQHPCFGYFDLPQAYFDAIIGWQRRHNGVTGLTKDDIGYQNGVVGGVGAAIRALTAAGEPVLVHGPTYIGFSRALASLGRPMVVSPLVRDAAGVWRMDYADMDRKIKDNHIHLAIFCSPHNPAGRVWERQEIEQAMAVYAANDVYVISDEIWSDLTLFGNRHVPTQSVSPDARRRTIAFYAPSKTFNLAGLVGSYHIIYNTYLRDRVTHCAQMTHYNGANVLSVHALIGAYTPEGDQWLDQLRQVLSDNVSYAYDFIGRRFKGVTLAKPQGTYMLYVDCHQWCQDHGISMDDLLKAGVAVGVIWQDGRPFGCPDTIRINLAVPHSQVVEAFDRLDRYVFNA